MKDFFKHITWKNSLRALFIIALILISFYWGLIGFGAITLFIAIVSLFEFDWEQFGMIIEYIDFVV